MKETDVEVLIVGAGPVGLSLAAELTRWGVSFRLVEKKLEAEQHSKAASWWPRTQEVSAAIGFGSQILKETLIIKNQPLHAYGKYIGAAPGGPYPSPYPYVRAVEQSYIERTIINYLAQAGQVVERGLTLTGLTQHSNYLEARLEKDGQASSLTCSYLVGCDGSNSAVRDLVGLKITPTPLPGSLQQIDAELSWSRPLTYDQLWFYLFDDGFCGFCPLPGGYYRIFLSRASGKLPDRNPTLEEMQSALRQITGDRRLELSNPVWFSHGKYQYGVAPSFQKGRVFLAGDAGHMTIPVGGQGMNTGIQDAFNLGWKLAGVLQGKYKPELLDSYSTERHKVRQELATDQATNFGRLLSPSLVQKLVTKFVAPIMLSRGGQSVELGKRDESQLSISYPNSPLNEDHLGKAGLKAGERVPDANLVEFTGLRPVRLFDLIYQTGWTLLAFDNNQGHSTLDRLGAAMNEVAQLSADIHPHIVTANQQASYQPGLNQLLDLDRQLHRAFKLKQPAFYLIRPDGYVAFRGGLSDRAALHFYCQNLFNISKPSLALVA